MDNAHILAAAARITVALRDNRKGPTMTTDSSSRNHRQGPSDGAAMPHPGRAARPHQVFHQSAGAVVMDGERCLVVRRADRPEWVLPKGHLERGETPVGAAIREVREETGIEIRIVADLGPTRFRFGPGLRHRKRVDWFLARRVGGEVALEPIFAEAAFLPEEEAIATLTHENDRQLVRRALELERRTGG